MTVIAARCDAVYAADCSRSTVRRISSEPGCSARETSHGEDPRPGIVRPLHRDGGVGLDARVRHDHDRVFGGEGIGVRVEGEVERGDGPRVRPSGAQAARRRPSPRAGWCRCRPRRPAAPGPAGWPPARPDPSPRRAGAGCPPAGAAWSGTSSSRSWARSRGRSFRGRSPPHPGPHDDESGQHQPGPEQLQGAERLPEKYRR